MEEHPELVSSAASARAPATPGIRPEPGRIREAAAVLLRGLGQLALVATPAGGALVLVAIFLINPWCGVGAAAGAMLGTLVGYQYTGVTGEEWHAGLAGFNCAVIGIMAGGFFAAETLPIGAILFAVTVCLTLEYGMRRLLLRCALPTLTMPAVIAVILTSLVLAPAGTWLWVSPGPPAFGMPGIALAMLCVVLAMASRSLAATVQVMVLTGVTVLACRILGIDPLAMIGLWAFTIAPASFTVHAVFMGGSLLGGVAGGVAAAIGATVWAIWHASGLGGMIPPLLAPFVIGVWCALLLFRRLGHPAVLQPAFWHAVAALVTARLRGNRVVAIITNTATHGSPAMLASRETATDNGFTESRSARRTWWQTCHDLRERLAHATPQSTHNALAVLQRFGWLDTVITFSMDGLLQRAGATRVVELQGRLETVRCLGCRVEREWPPVSVWKSCDLHCSECGDLIRPGPPAASEIIESIRLSISRSLARDDVLMVLGTLEESRAARTVLGEARARGARIINITPAPSSTPLHAGEVLVRSTLCNTLRYLVRVLVTLFIAARASGVRFAGAGTEVRGQIS